MSEKIDYDNATEMHEMADDLGGYLNTFTEFKTPELVAELDKLTVKLSDKCDELELDAGESLTYDDEPKD